MKLKKGQNFSIYGDAKNYDGSPLNLDGFTLSSNMVCSAHTIELTPVILNSEQGKFRLDGAIMLGAADSYKFDVKFSNGVIFDYSQTVTITATAAVTE